MTPQAEQGGRNPCRCSSVALSLPASRPLLPRKCRHSSKKHDTSLGFPAACRKCDAAAKRAGIDQLIRKRAAEGRRPRTLLGDFRINGKPIRGLIDTGATYVAVNKSTARRLGFGAADLDYRYSVSTANGETKAAFVKIGRMIR